MSRKSKWLPGQPEEPGATTDNLSFGYVGPGQTPVQDITTGVIFLIGTSILIPLCLSVSGGKLNLGATLVTVFVSLALFLGAVYTLQRGIRRWVWRKKNASNTGSRYVKPWERS